MEQQEKISMEDIDKIEKIFNVEYSDTVKYAVRYGYNYRIEAEQKHNSYSHACFRYICNSSMAWSKSN